MFESAGDEMPSFGAGAAGGFHLEEPAGLGRVHPLRPLPGQLPGSAHRQAALAQEHHPEALRADARGRLVRQGHARRSSRPAGRKAAKPAELPALHGEVIEADELWACTTCRSCVQQCPVFIDQLGSIIEMRRFLTLSEGAVPKSAADALKTMETAGNPYSLPKAQRLAWAADLDVPRAAAGQQVRRALLGRLRRRLRPARAGRRQGHGEHLPGGRGDLRRDGRGEVQRASRRGAWVRSTSTRPWPQRTSRT